MAMQSCFQKTDDREAVTIMASNIVNTQQGTFSDDGVSQQAIIKTGVTTKDAAFVPNPVSLIPYRTFWKFRSLRATSCSESARDAAEPCLQAGGC